MSTAKLVKVTLTRPHTHAGVKYMPGQVISVSAADAQWLQDRGVGNLKVSRPLTSKSGVNNE